MPEFGREGRAFCQFWFQGGKYNETPTDKRTRPLRAPLGPPDSPPPPFWEKGGDSKKYSLRTEISEVEGSEGTTTGPSSGQFGGLPC